jgi:hypothetical protein
VFFGRSNAGRSSKTLVLVQGKASRREATPTGQVSCDSWRSTIDISVSDTEKKIIMQRDLTKRYSLSFKKKQGGRNPFSLFYDLYRYGKLREFSSFIVWELLHKLHLFPGSSYLVFNNQDVLKLEKDGWNVSDFNEKVARFFDQRNLSVSRTNHNWKLLFMKSDWEMIGCLSPEDTDLYRSTDQGKSVVFIHRFPESIKSIFVSSRNTIFVCAKGAVYRSADNGATFEKAFDLGSSESFFRFNNAMTETPDHRLMVAEYGNVWEKGGWRKLAYLYFSSDDGQTWQTSDFLIKQGANKHVHIVKYSKLLNRIIVADGDNYKRLWLSAPLESFDLEKPQWELINRFHIQMGGYTAAVESDDRVFFGTDYQGGTNFIIESTDGNKFTKKVVPDPYRRSPIDNMVLRKSKRGTEIWANLPFSTGNTKCLLMYSADNGRTWNRVIEYSRSAHTVWLISSSNEIAEELYFLVTDSKNNTRVVYKIADVP